MAGPSPGKTRSCLNPWIGHSCMAG
jgi:hypothetical protein